MSSSTIWGWDGLLTHPNKTIILSLLVLMKDQSLLELDLMNRLSAFLMAKFSGLNLWKFSL